MTQAHLCTKCIRRYTLRRPIYFGQRAGRRNQSYTGKWMDTEEGLWVAVVLSLARLQNTSSVP